MADVNFVNKSAQENKNNSAYVRVKISHKPVVAKMLVDSGNLVNDLISEDFAKQIRVKYTLNRAESGDSSKRGICQNNWTQRTYPPIHRKYSTRGGNYALCGERLISPD